jgi:hypothetical protein
MAIPTGEFLLVSAPWAIAMTALMAFFYGERKIAEKEKKTDIDQAVAGRRLEQSARRLASHYTDLDKAESALKEVTSKDYQTRWEATKQRVKKDAETPGAYKLEVQGDKVVTRDLAAESLGKLWDMEELTPKDQAIRLSGYIAKLKTQIIHDREELNRAAHSTLDLMEARTRTGYGQRELSGLIAQAMSELAEPLHKHPEDLDLMPEYRALVEKVSVKK